VITGDEAYNRIFNKINTEFKEEKTDIKWVEESSNEEEESEEEINIESEDKNNNEILDLNIKVPTKKRGRPAKVKDLINDQIQIKRGRPKKNDKNKITQNDGDNNTLIDESTQPKNVDFVYDNGGEEIDFIN
jgi:hypothetical protein